MSSVVTSSSVVVSLVKIPLGWQPLDWADEPAALKVVSECPFDHPAEAEHWRRTWNENELLCPNGFWAIVRHVAAQHPRNKTTARQAIIASIAGISIRIRLGKSRCFAAHK